MQIKDVMSKDIVNLNSNDSIERAAQLMRQFDVGAIPVCDDSKKLVGIITDRDIALDCVASGANPNEQKICDFMTSEPVCGSPDMDVYDAIRLMSRNQIRRLPVVENNNLVGIVSLGDISQEPTLQDNAEVALRNISEPGTNNHI
ncbi:CBS domain-containing protein [Clostridium chromiireducens]|uniref:CBS domain-containing protein n=1 Tax=Clostridium chromiireducens TaxID=225345 RepID=A0A399IMT9_9CLOT|nr:CBS domain-containing protein [Clostridium chromiireducens]MVX63226.1 CBS domain-containing protein [Clostridium chromiireducens]RII33877.1 CBS domain-containing protein [Clostridium chromiireducens]